MYDVPPKPLDEFKQAIRALIENPEHPEYARIQELEGGGSRYYPLPFDPFFNPKARAKLEEEEESPEGDTP